MSPPRASTAITPTAPDSSTTGWTKPGSSPSARPSSRPPRAGCSPRTASTSTSSRTASPVPPGTPRRSAAVATGPAPPASARPAPAARYASSAPRPPADAASASARMSSSSPHARHRQRDPDWVADYRATRPKVERKIGHLMRRRHGGRRARVRGQTKVAADFALLAAAVNLARLGVLAVASTPGPRMGHRSRVDQSKRTRSPYPAAETLTTTPPSPAKHRRTSITAARPALRQPRRLTAAPAPAAAHRQPFDTSHPVRLRL